MAEKQKSSNDRLNQESKSKSGVSGSSDMREGKAKGNPSNVRGEKDTDISRKNKEGKPDETRIRDEGLKNSRSTGNDINRSRDNESDSRRN